MGDLVRGAHPVVAVSVSLPPGGPAPGQALGALERRPAFGAVGDATCSKHVVSGFLLRVRKSRILEDERDFPCHLE